MRDTTLLRRRIESLIGIATLTAGVTTTACDRTETTTQAGPDPSVTTKTKTTATATESTPVPTASTSAVPTGPITIVHTGGGCPPWDWCGPASDVKTHAKPGGATKLGCAVELQQNPKGATIPGVAYFSRAELDETKTKDARADAGKAATCCYTMHRLCGGGRPLADGDVALVAEVRAGDAWHDALAKVSCAGLDDEARRALGERWSNDARMEHASVASFARAALELMAVGAPPELVADCHRAALDEVRHAQACFAVASQLLGRAIEPGPLPMPALRPCTLIDVARTTLIEGCIGETASALVATRAANDCEDDGLREVLERIADDETGHAALAFRIVRWCMAQGGPDVVDAVRAAMQHAREQSPDESLHHVVEPLLACP